MKTPRHKKVLGLSLGERSLLVAEVVSGDQITVTRTAELVYPAGITPANPSALGGALASFLSKEGFTAKSVVVGLPARWLVTQPKEVPAADAKTKAEMLRLSAEAEFSTELKDLVYDFTGSGSTVLLVATPKRYVEAAVSMCETARISLDIVTATALALGDATGRAAAKDVLVLSVASGGAEMTVQRDASSGAVRHLRAPQPEAPFINELRRAASMLPSSKSGRELILWDGTGLDAKTLSDQIGVQVRSGDLPMLGIAAGSNGTAGNGQHGSARTGQYGAAIALALQGILDKAAPIDFLHSRLAPPKTHRVPRWAILAGVVVVLFIGGIIWAYHDLHLQEADVDKRQAVYDGMKSRIDDTRTFVDKVAFAQAWYGGDPRYIACIRDMTIAMSDDPDTFAISLIVNEPPHVQNSKTPDTHALTGVLQGKAADQQHVISLVNRLRRYPAFAEVTPGGSDTAAKGREVTFSVGFKYQLQPLAK